MYPSVVQESVNTTLYKLLVRILPDLQLQCKLLDVNKNDNNNSICIAPLYLWSLWRYINAVIIIIS